MYWIVKDYSVHNTGTSREDNESYAKLFLLGFTFGSFPDDLQSSDSGLTYTSDLVDYRNKLKQQAK